MDSFSISFKTKFADLPDISGTVPADGSINVPIDTSMVVTFDNDMDLSTINTDNITVNGDNSLISSITTNAAQPRQAIINFQNLDYVTLYNVKFSGIKSKSGRTIADRTVSFVTAVEEEIVYYNGFNDTSDLSWPKWSAGPIITSLNTDTAVSAPSSGYLVPPYDAGEMWFGQEGSAPLVPGEVYTISLWMKSSSDTNNGLYMVKSDESAFVFNIPKLNTEWTYYTSTFTATSIPMPFFRSKDTVPFFVDDLKVIKYPETVVLPNSTITDGAENVAINGPYTLVFSNNVDTASLTGNNIKINGQNVVITGTSSNTVTFNPGSPLSNSSVCTLSVNITDANNKAVIYSATFETAERFITSGIKVYRDYQGATQADVTNGALTNGKYTAVLSQLTNNATGPAEAALIAVLYKDSEMVDASYSRVHLNSGESILNPLTASIDLPASLSDGIYTYKAFLWNGLGDITPVIKNIVINE